MAEMENTCSRMFNLVTRLLDISKVENLIEKITIKEEDICQIVRRCAAFHKKAAESKGIDLFVDTPENPIIIETNSDIVVQKLVKVMKGTICCKSKMGKGSTFSVQLPIGQSPKIK